MKKEGSVFGGILMIAGSSIGAGMLALPVITGPGGFVSATLFFFVAWLFMMGTAFALLNVNCILGTHLSLISLVSKTLGRVGKALTWLLFLFLFYSLGVAYISASGSIVRSLTGDLLPSYVGSLFFTLLFGYVVFLGTKKVDYLNRLLMAGLVITYLLLITLGLPFIKSDFLLSGSPLYTFAALPILVVSFGFHNMIPSLVEYFKGDVKRLKITLFFGSLIPLFIYLLFEIVMLGIIPIEGQEGLSAALDKGEAVTSALRKASGITTITLFADGFALFAIVTSFLTQSLSLVDFLADGLKITKTGKKRVLLILLTLAPSSLFAFLYPCIFIKALNYAGGFSAALLFGVLPPLMLWTLHRKKQAHLSRAHLFTLILLILFALFIFGLECAQELGFSLIPPHPETLKC